MPSTAPSPTLPSAKKYRAHSNPSAAYPKTPAHNLLKCHIVFVCTYELSSHVVIALYLHICNYTVSFIAFLVINSSLWLKYLYGAEFWNLKLKNFHKELIHTLAKEQFWTTRGNWWMLSATGPDKQNTWWLGGTDMHAEVQGVHYILSFSLNVVIFLNSASSAAVLVFDLSLCTHTVTEGKPRKARVRNIS